MSDEQPPGRPSSHRAPVSRGGAFRRDVRGLVPPVAAVSAVIAVIIGLLVLNGRSTPSGGPTVQPPADHSVGLTPTTQQTPSVQATHPATTPPSVTPATATPRVRPSATQAAAAPRLPVDVLNNSRRTGLAHHVAGQVAAVGWPVDVVGNFRGRIIASTLYYDRGQRASALRLAHAMPAIRRVLPRFEGLPGSGLTLVVTRDWPT